MSTARRWTVVGAALVLATTGFLAQPAAAAPAPVVISAVTWGLPSLTVNGLAMATQTVSLHLTSSVPFSSCLIVIMTGTGGTGTVRDTFVQPTLATGTTTDGTWTSSFYVPSTADGTWTLTGAYDCGDAGGGPVVSITDTSAYAVTGHHQPRMSYGYVPNPLAAQNPYGVVKGRVYDADTGLGVAGVTVGHGFDTHCGQGPFDGRSRFTTRAVTNAAGYYTLPSDRLDELNCVGILGPHLSNPDGYSVYVWFHNFFAVVGPVVTASPQATRVKAGTVDPVTGQAFGSHRGCAVQLQRLTGSTAWRVVSSGNVRDSLRYTILAQPPRAGANIYRVVLPACHMAGYTDMAQAISPVFTITAT